MKALILSLYFIFFSCFAQAKTPQVETPSGHWHSVSHTCAQPAYKKRVLKISAEQAELETRMQPAVEINKSGYPIWYGYSGPMNVHTRNLRFEYERVVYSIPQPFVADLLDMHVNNGRDSMPVLISMHNSDIVFTIDGSDGEKAYTAHFHFRKGKFFQRFLSASEGTYMIFRTVAE